MDRKTYHFIKITACEMCGDSTDDHRILGQRLNTSQGFRPKNKTGISVTVKECRVCGLIYCDPLPIPNSLDDHYGIEPGKYWKKEYLEGDDPYFFQDQIVTAQSILSRITGITALDIGAGFGKTMQAMERAGMDAYGIEPSKEFSDMAFMDYDIDDDHLQVCRVENARYPENTFDFITMGAVFEHLKEPSLALSRVLHWLKPDGVIHIDVPHSRFLYSKIINRYFRLRGTNYVTNLSPMHPPFHLYEFSLESFQVLGKRLGFEIEKVEYWSGGFVATPNFLKPLMRWLMRITKRESQLIVWIKKRKYEG